uniref:Knottin scorpion toxin-like domain-containing protein n=1 Tax=Oryza brachyantha TaxID=4533 RepID=J3NAC4_ORYBR
LANDKNKKTAVLFIALMVMATVNLSSCHTTQGGYEDSDRCMYLQRCDMSKCMSACQITGNDGGECAGDLNDHCCCT